MPWNSNDDGPWGSGGSGPSNNGSPKNNNPWNNNNNIDDIIKSAKEKFYKLKYLINITTIGINGLIAFLIS